MPVEKLRDYLDSNNIKYISIRHSPAITAQEVAASAHISGKELAKTVIVKIDGRMAMAVLPASCQVDFEIFKRATGADKVELASEDEFKGLFPDSDIGAMPPFGNLYGMEVYVAPQLTEDREISFNAGSHYELMQLAYGDFAELVKPRVTDLARKPETVRPV